MPAPRDSECTAQPPRSSVPVLALGLALLTLAVFAPAVRHDFVSFDDDLYVSENPQVLAGLTGPSLTWAWTTLYAGYYQPVTWMSFQLDAQLFGSAPWGFHLSNVLWHTANVLLLFFVLHRLTGASGPAAAVAALFAVHPMHVEAVAWVTARKDLLSLFFALLAIWAYAAYAERRSPIRYTAVLVATALSLLAKPVAVTLPFILLLLDYWPLRRFVWQEPVSCRRQACGLVTEKLPLLALAIGASVLTVYAHGQVGGLIPLWRLPIGTRLTNAVTGYVWYLEKTFWPVNLVPFYPYIGASPAWRDIAGCTLVLLAVTALAVGAIRRRPYLPVGWFWFVGALVPVIGLVKAGTDLVADRFSYFPHMGLFLCVVWGACDLLGRLPWARRVQIGTALAACLALAVGSWVQLGHWRDSFTLLNYTLVVAEANPAAHNALGVALAGREQLGEAAEHYARAVQLDPDSPKARLNLAQTLLTIGRPADAVPHLRAVLHVFPDVPMAQFQLGVALVQAGRSAEAIEPFAAAARLDPTMTHAHYNLGVLRAEQGETDAAIAHFHTVLELDPDYEPSPHTQLGKLLTRAGRLDEAIEAYRAAQRRRPASPSAAYDLGRALARRERWGEAETALRQAVQMQSQVVHGHAALAQALSRQGRHAAAREEYQVASRLDANWPRAAADEAWSLATHPDARRRDGAFAVQLAEQACEATAERDARLLDVLASAYAEAGQFERARGTAAKALALAGDDAARRAITERLEFYRTGRPYRTTAAAPR